MGNKIPCFFSTRHLHQGLKNSIFKPLAFAAGFVCLANMSCRSALFSFARPSLHIWTCLMVPNQLPAQAPAASWQKPREAASSWGLHQSAALGPPASSLRLSSWGSSRARFSPGSLQDSLRLNRSLQIGLNPARSGPPGSSLAEASQGPFRAWRNHSVTLPLCSGPQMPGIGLITHLCYLINILSIDLCEARSLVSLLPFLPDFPLASCYTPMTLVSISNHSHVFRDSFLLVYVLAKMFSVVLCACVYNGCKIVLCYASHLLSYFLYPEPCFQDPCVLLGEHLVFISGVFVRPWSQGGFFRDPN